MFGFGGKTDVKYMKTALKEANKAYRDNDVPIGCIIVSKEGKVIAKAHNRRNRDGSTLSHAEILAIGQACKKVKDWRLEGCTMYVTLEPCQMCAGAIVQARMDKVVIGCMNKKAGCCGSVINLLQMSQFNHQVEIERGVLEEECSSIISDFFKELREEKQQQKAAGQTVELDPVGVMWKNADDPDAHAKYIGAQGASADLPAAGTAGTAGARTAAAAATAASSAAASGISAGDAAAGGKNLSNTDKLLAMDDLLLAALAEDGDNVES